jgi:Ca2+-binding RTX toxin-like protein
MSLKPTARVFALAVAVGSIGLTNASSASAQLGCSLTPPPNSTVTFTAGPDDYEVRLIRVGDEIKFGDPNGRAVVGKGKKRHEVKFLDAVACPTTPTVTNVDSIAIQLSNADADERTVEISLAGGPFGPGATPEADGSSEIEMTALTDPNGVVEFAGTPGDDTFRFGVEGTVPGVNLNAATEAVPDVDVTLPIEPSVDPEDNKELFAAPLAFASGGPGNDSFSTAGGPEFDSGFGRIAYFGGGPGNDTIFAASTLFGFLAGSKGNDRIAGGDGYNIMLGGAGNDTLIGGPAANGMIPGPGRDLAIGGGGFDKIDSTDSQRDTVRCGAGHDTSYRDRRDRLSGCERRNKGHAHFGFFD